MLVWEVLENWGCIVLSNYWIQRFPYLNQFKSSVGTLIISTDDDEAEINYVMGLVTQIIFYNDIM